MFNNLSLAKKIYFALSIFGIVILITTISIFYIDEQELAEELVKDNIEASAQSYFDTVNTMMLTGTMANRKIFQDKILAQGDIVEARIIRAPKVIELFGKGFDNQKPQDELDQIGLQGEKKFQLVEKNGKRLMQFVLPMLAKSNYRGTDCLACHQASENEILGVVKISYDLTRVDEQIISSLTKASIFQLIIMIISFVTLGYIIFKLVIFRLKQLEITINDVERDLDFSKEITIHRHDELGAVSRAFNNMILKFRTSFITVSNASNDLINSAEQVNEIADLTKEAVLIQKNGTDSVATAINELDASASEVENNTKFAAEKSVLAERKAQQGLSLASNAREGIDQLSDQVSNNMGLINELNEKISEVGSVLDVITSMLRVNRTVRIINTTSVRFN